MDSRVALVLSVVLAAFAVVQTTGAPPKPAGGGYTTKYDNIDIDQIFSSKRLVNNYVQCLVDKKPCSPDAAELRKMLPEVIRTQCGKCSSQQKNVAYKIIQRLQKEFPNEWQQLLNKWDPKRELLAKFDEYMKEEYKKGFIKF